MRDSENPLLTVGSPDGAGFGALLGQIGYALAHLRLVAVTPLLAYAGLRPRVLMS